MAHPRKRRRKDADAFLSHGGFGEDVNPSSSIPSLNTLRVHQLNVKQNGKVATRQYSVWLPIVGAQNLVYQPSWYSTLFERYNITQPTPEWLSNDLDHPTIYDRVLDEQVAVKTHIRVTFFWKQKSGLEINKEYLVEPTQGVDAIYTRLHGRIDTARWTWRLRRSVWLWALQSQI